MEMSIYIFSFTFLMCLAFSNSSHEDTRSPDSKENLGVASVIPYAVNFVEILDTESLKEYKNSAVVTTVYFYKKDMLQLKSFFKEYDKSAEYLKAYGVNLGVFDCMTYDDEQCKTKHVEQNIYMYRGGASLLQLELQTMFDVNSIMSNILQLVLLRDAPIIQTADDLEAFMYTHKGTKDIIFTYQKAIGTYEHRIFMEVAYAYHESFQFAVSTNKDALTGHFDITDEDDVRVWFLGCKDLPGKAKPCEKIPYIGGMFLGSLARYLKILTKPPIFWLPDEGKDSPYYDINHVIMYYTELSHDQVDDTAKQLSHIFRGMFGILIIDMDRVDDKFADHSGQLPWLCFKPKNRDKPVFYPHEDWHLSIIIEFLSAQWKDYEMNPDKFIKSPPKEPEETIDDSDIPEYQKELYPDITAIETEDDQVAEAVFRSKRRSPNLDLVMTLTDKTFPTVLEKDLLFVLFFLPFDHRSMATLFAYGEASRSFENETVQPLARMNCYDWTDVCGKENITSYPTIRIYRKGRSEKYRGMLDTQEVVKAVRLLNLDDATDLKTKEDIQMFSKGNLPGGGTIVTDAAVLGLFDSKHKKESEEFHTVSHSLHKQMVFGINSDGLGADIASKVYKTELPAVILLRKTDPLQPFTVFSGKMDKTLLEKFSLENRIPIMPELTVYTFPLLYKERKPFVVTFLNEDAESDFVKQIMSKVAKNSKFTHIRFCWMLAVKNSVGMSVLKKYRKTEDDVPEPAVSFVHLQEGGIYNYPQTINEERSVVDWITGITSKEVETSSKLSEGIWKPQYDGYNFLAMMDWEQNPENRKMRDESRDKAMELHGIGFDEEGNEYLPMKVHRAEMLRHDNEGREELLELQNSRLYRHANLRKSLEKETGDGTLKIDESKLSSINTPTDAQNSDHEEVYNNEQWTGEATPMEEETHPHEEL